MPDSSHLPQNDSELIARIAREVIERITLGKTSSSAGPTIGGRLVSLATLAGIADGSEVAIASGAVVTPAARDEASLRDIRFVVGSRDAPRSSASASAVSSDDDVLVVQLARRGMTIPAGTDIHWTSRPADAVWRLCQQGQRAAMIGCFSDVDRFAQEMRPTAWVLDSKKLNLNTAVNAAARIVRIAGGQQ